MIRIFFKPAALMLFAGAAGAGAPAAPADACAHFQALGWPDSTQLRRYQPVATFPRGAREDAGNHFYNLDIDGDDIGDEVSYGCSASIIPADPCQLTVTVSSSGGAYVLEAWRMFLVRQRGDLYVVTSDLETSKDPKPHKIYRLTSTAALLVCQSPKK